MNQAPDLRPLLLEIGTEEIPARFLPGAISDLRDIAANVFHEYRIEYETIKTFATPRRLVLSMAGVSPMQSDVAKEIFGPSRKAAFDDQGNPTKAAIGFAASLGISTSDLVLKTKAKGEYVAAVIHEKGAESATVLPEIIKKIVLSLHFPKSMRWGNRDLLFVRPIHWLLSIFGQETVKIEIDGIESGNMTRGHRFLSPASFQIKEIASYIHLLENNFVMLDQEKRLGVIRDGITSLAETVKGTPLLDEDLLSTVNFLVEYPVPVLCGFSEEYLALPKELLITVMKDHQKYFAVLDEKGDLLNNFIVVSNTKAENAETVKIGAERVIKARFDDAKFYFSDDRKRTLHSRIEDLKHVTFHDELGNLLEKTNRIVSVNSYLAGKINPALGDSRAAFLSKTDLITGVVREFPELQGVMGKYYARHDGEDPSVSEALEEQYLPKSYGGRLPVTDAGAMLSLADKIDNVASFFSIGLTPTGSEDPFALRRQAIGIVSIMVDKGYQISLRDVFVKALGNLPSTKDAGKVLESILGFMEQRVEFVFASMGHAQDVTKSALSLSSSYPLRSIMKRLDALRTFKADEIFQDFLLAIKRVNNIVPKTPLPAVNPDLILQDEEKALFSAFNGLRHRIVPLLEGQRFYEGLKTLAEITSPVNSFFDKVLVMDKQEEIKLNRLSMLKEIWDTASLFADFSKLL